MKCEGSAGGKPKVLLKLNGHAFKTHFGLHRETNERNCICCSLPMKTLVSHLQNGGAGGGGKCTLIVISSGSEKCVVFFTLMGVNFQLCQPLDFLRLLKYFTGCKRH